MVAASWFAFTACGVMGYVRFRQGRTREAAVGIALYSLSGLVGLAHYLDIPASQLSAFQHAHVATDIVLGVLLFAFAVMTPPSPIRGNTVSEGSSTAAAGDPTITARVAIATIIRVNVRRDMHASRAARPARGAAGDRDAGRLAFAGAEEAPAGKTSGRATTRGRTMTDIQAYPPSRYRGEGGEVSARMRRASQAPDLVLGNTGVHYLATGASTDGLFGLYRWEMDGNRGGAAPHMHRSFSESFYVLSGQVRVFDGQGWVDAGPGDYVYVPPGGIHGFANESGAPASMLILFSPGAPREAYFEGLPTLGEMGDEERAAFFRAHDNLYLGE